MLLASSISVPIPRHHFERMLAFSRMLYRLKNRKNYLHMLEEKLPEVAKIIPDTPAMLMGFDFHLTDEGAKLIEVNNDAGGLYSEALKDWLPQPQIEEMPGETSERLLGMFPSHWKSIAIVDDEIEEQFMYPEMQAYAELLKEDDREVYMGAPEALQLKDDGLYFNGHRLDAIYNRHTDFYLDTEPMQHIRKAYMSGLIQLNPHPRSYALLGDKARMADWWHEGVLESCLEPDEIQLIRTVVPEIHLMHEYDSEQAWAERAGWVFKPAARHGGKGVLLGKSISRKRFDDFNKGETVMQRYVPASLVEIGDNEFKFDVRLFMQGEKLISLAGRVWQGQVTNFRAEGSGWVSLEVTD